MLICCIWPSWRVFYHWYKFCRRFYLRSMGRKWIHWKNRPWSSSFCNSCIRSKMYFGDISCQQTFFKQNWELYHIGIEREIMAGDQQWHSNCRGRQSVRTRQHQSSIWQLELQGVDWLVNWQEVHVEVLGWDGTWRVAHVDQGQRGVHQRGEWEESS